MNLKTPKPNTNFWIIIGTLSFLALAYIFYMNFYVAGKESRIISTRFRVLEQMGNNINNKISSYSSNAANLESKIMKRVEEIYDSVWYLRDGYRKKVIKDKVNEYIKNKGHINKDLNIVDIIDVSEKNPANILYQKNIKDFYYLDNVRISIASPTLIFDVVITTEYENLIKGLERQDVFDGIMLFRDSTIVYNSLNEDLLLNLTRLDIDPEIEKTIKKIEEDKNGSADHSLLLFPRKTSLYAGKIYSGELTNVSISNNPYKLFLKPLKVNGEYWHVGGIMKEESYNAAKRSIPPWVVISLSVLLVLIIFSLPIIKLQVLSKIERLDTSTVINSAVSLLLGGSIAALFLFFVTQNLSGLLKVDHNLQELSTEITNNFEEEIKLAYKQLEIFDNNYESIDDLNSPNPASNKIWVDILNDSTGHLIYPSIYQYSDFVFWANVDGMQTLELTPFNAASQLISIKTRDYFNQKDKWYLPDQTNRKFRLESILSLTTGNHKVALSKKSDSENEVIGLTSRFYSIVDPIMLNNYSYCIIDESGKVWFHSNKEHNLMENLLNESNLSKYLQSALYSKKSLLFSLNYYNKPHRAYIKPISNLPLYMVTMYNREADKSFHAQVFTMTMLLLGAFFFLIFIQVLFLLSIERLLQWKLNKNLIMQLTRPMFHLNNEYKYLTWMNGILFLITIPFVFFMSDQQAIASTFALQIMLFGYAHWILNANPLKKRQRQWFAIFNFTLLVIINLLSFLVMNGQGYLLVLFFQFVIFISIYLLHFILAKRKLILADNYNKNYAIFLLSILLFFGIIPALKFYESAYNTERWLRTKHNQFELMKKYEHRNEKLAAYYKSINRTTVIDSVQIERRSKGIYTAFQNNTTIQPINAEIKSLLKENKMQTNVWNKLIYLFRPFYDDYVSDNKAITYNQLANDSISWSLIDDVLYLKYSSNTTDIDQKKPELMSVKSEVELLRFVNPFKTHGYRGMIKGLQFVFNLLFWLLIVTILYVLYHLIKFGTTKIFSLNVIETYSHQSFSDILKNQMLANKDILIYRQSSADDTNELYDDVRKSANSLCIDWSNELAIKNTRTDVNKLLKSIDKKANDKISDIKKQPLSLTVFIDHLDWNFSDLGTIRNKLSIVRELMGRDDIRLIMLSQVHPHSILSYYENLIQEAKEGDTKYEEWLKLFKGLHQLLEILIIEPLPVKYHHSWQDEEKHCDKKARPISIPNLIEAEMNASDYLKQFEQAIYNYNELHCMKTSCENPEERIIAKIISLAGKYYKDLVNSCTDEEKYILHDFADDLIMNPRNEASIYRLLEKGVLIKKCDRINFMNISFRRYVLGSLTKASVAEFELKMGKKAGTWQGYRATLLIIIIALFGFIAMANQDFLDNLNQLFVAIGGGIAVITAILGLLSRKNVNTSD